MSRAQTSAQKAMILCSGKDIAAFVQAALKPFGFQEIHALENGIDALRRLAETSYDLVVCHNRIRFISGWEFIKEMKISERIPNMAAILMGDTASPASEGELQQYGLMNYLKTPMNESQLSFRIHSTFHLFKTSGTVENKFSKAKAALLGKKIDLAIELYAELHGLTKKNSRSSFGLAESLLQNDEIEKAETILRESLKVNGPAIAAIILQVKIHLRKDRIAEARAACDAVLAKEQSSPFYHVRLLNIFGEADRLVESDFICSDAIRKQFKILVFWQTHARMQFQKARYDESLATLQSAMEIFGPRAELLNIKGACLRKADRLADALQTYEEALALSPMDSKIYYNMALCFISRKDFVAAQRHLEICLKIAPSFSSARDKLAELKKFIDTKKP